MGVSFETCLRRRGDVLIGRRCYILSRRRHNCPIKTTETSRQCSIKTSLGVLFETDLRSRWDIQRDVVRMLPQSFVDGFKEFKNNDP